MDCDCSCFSSLLVFHTNKKKKIESKRTWDFLTLEKIFLFLLYNIILYIYIYNIIYMCVYNIQYKKIFFSYNTMNETNTQCNGI